MAESRLHLKYVSDISTHYKPREFISALLPPELKALSARGYVWVASIKSRDRYNDALAEWLYWLNHARLPHCEDEQIRAEGPPSTLLCRQDADTLAESARRLCQRIRNNMYKASDAFQEGLRRFLAEGGFAWAERPGPPPPGVKILKNAHPPRIAERLCEEGSP